MTGDIILQLCKTLLSSFLFTVQVTAFKGSRQQNTQKKGGGGGHKKWRDGAFQEETGKTGTLQLEADMMEILGGNPSRQWTLQMHYAVDSNGRFEADKRSCFFTFWVVNYWLLLP